MTSVHFSLQSLGQSKHKFKFKETRFSFDRCRCFMSGNSLPSKLYSKTLSNFCKQVEVLWPLSPPHLIRFCSTSNFAKIVQSYYNVCKF